MKRILACALLLSLGLPAAAQERRRPAPPVRKTDPQEISGVRYTAELRSGRKVSGVVRASGVFEVWRDNTWQEADQEEPGAGVRLWFPASQAGFIFVRVGDLKRLEEDGEVTPGEARKVANAIDAARDRAKKERVELTKRWEEEAEADAERKKALIEREEIATQAHDEETELEEAAENAKLLVTFPPTKWTPERPAEIEHRRVVLGLFPSDDEKAFLAVFDKWKRAYELWKKSKEKAAAEKTGEAAGDKGKERPVDSTEGDSGSDAAQSGLDTADADSAVSATAAR